MNKNIAIATHTAQQGDVVLKRLTSLPDGQLKSIAKRRLILAEGEATGHHHSIEQADSELLEAGGVMVLDLKETATLTHQEHGPITLEKGLWEVGRVQEYDYFAQMKRKVVD
jgi:hypothetical protein